MFAFEYFKHLSKSFKYSMNRRGPRQEPCGIVILVILDAEIVYYICKLGTNVGRKD